MKLPFMLVALGIFLVVHRNLPCDAVSTTDQEFGVGRTDDSGFQYDADANDTRSNRNIDDENYDILPRSKGILYTPMSKSSRKQKRDSVDRTIDPTSPPPSPSPSPSPSPLPSPSPPPRSPSSSPMLISLPNSLQSAVESVISTLDMKITTTMTTSTTTTSSDSTTTTTTSSSTTTSTSTSTTTATASTTTSTTTTATSTGTTTSTSTTSSSATTETSTSTTTNTSSTSSSTTTTGTSTSTTTTETTTSTTTTETSTSTTSSSTTTTETSTSTTTTTSSTSTSSSMTTTGTSTSTTTPETSTAGTNTSSTTTTSTVTSTSTTTTETTSTTTTETSTRTSTTTTETTTTTTTTTTDTSTSTSTTTTTSTANTETTTTTGTSTDATTSTITTTTSTSTETTSTTTTMTSTSTTTTESSTSTSTTTTTTTTDTSISTSTTTTTSTATTETTTTTSTSTDATTSTITTTTSTSTETTTSTTKTTSTTTTVTSTITTTTETTSPTTTETSTSTSTTTTEMTTTTTTTTTDTSTSTSTTTTTSTATTETTTTTSTSTDAITSTITTTTSTSTETTTSTTETTSTTTTVTSTSTTTTENTSTTTTETSTSTSTTTETTTTTSTSTDTTTSTTATETTTTTSTSTDSTTTSTTTTETTTTTTDTSTSTSTTTTETTTTTSTSTDTTTSTTPITTNRTLMARTLTVQTSSLTTDPLPTNTACAQIQRYPDMVVATMRLPNGKEVTGLTSTTFTSARSNRLTFLSVLSGSEIVNCGANITTQWSLIPQNTNGKSELNSTVTPIDQKVLDLSSSIVRALRSDLYIVKVVTVLTSNKGTVLTQKVVTAQLQLLYAPLVARIGSGEAYMMRSNAKDLALNVQSSLDPDDPCLFQCTCQKYCTMSCQDCKAANPGFLSLDIATAMVWTCTAENSTSCLLKLPTGTNSTFVEIKAGEAPAGKYNISVSFSRGNRSANTSVTLEFVAANVPVVSIQGPAAPIDPTIRLLLQGNVLLSSNSSSTMTYLWEGFDNNGQIDMKKATKDGTKKALILEPNVLSLLQSPYRFRLSASLTELGVQTTGQSIVDVTVNDLPAGGNCAISPQNGTYLTPYEIQCSGWKDNDSSDKYPLRYQFLVNGGLPLRAVPNNNPYIQSTIAAGTPENKYFVQIAALISDRYGATTAYPLGNVSVYPPATADSMVAMLNTCQDIISGGVQMMKDSGDPGSAISAVQTVANYMNRNTTFVANGNVTPNSTGTSEETKQKGAMREQVVDSLIGISGDTLTENTASGVEQISSVLSQVLARPGEIYPAAQSKSVDLVVKMADILKRDSGAVSSNAVNNMVLSVDYILQASQTNTDNSATVQDSATVSGNGTVANDVTKSAVQALQDIAFYSLKDTAIGEDPVTMEGATFSMITQKSDLTSLSMNITTAKAGAFVANVSDALASYDFGAFNPVSVDANDVEFNTQLLILDQSPFGSTNNSVNGTVVSFSLRDTGSGDALDVRNLPGCILIAIPANTDSISKDVSPGCRYWNTTTEVWSTEGVSLHSTESSGIVCCAEHLTFFGIKWSDVVVPINQIDIIEDSSLFLQYQKKPQIIFTIGILVGLYLSGALFFLHKDRKAQPATSNADHAFSYLRVEIETGSDKDGGLHPNAQLSIRFFGSLANTAFHHLPRPLTRQSFYRTSIEEYLLSYPDVGNISDLELKIDLASSEATWHVANITVTELELGHVWSFNINRWLAVQPGKKSVSARSTVSKRFIVDYGWTGRFRILSSAKLSDEHLWLSLSNLPVASNFTRLERWTLCFTMILGNMTVLAAFYHGSEYSSWFNRAYVGVVSSLMVLPGSILLTFVLRRARRSSKKTEQGQAQPEMGAPERKLLPGLYNTGDAQHEESFDTLFMLPSACRYIAYVAMFLTSVGCIYVCMLYGLKMVENQVFYPWLSSFFISFCESVFISQPVTCYIQTAFRLFELRHKKSPEFLI